MGIEAKVQQLLEELQKKNKGQGTYDLDDGDEGYDVRRENEDLKR